MAIFSRREIQRRIDRAAVLLAKPQLETLVDRLNRVGRAAVEAITKKIRAVSIGGGGIYIDLTLEAAYAALAAESVQLKHLLLFSDGSDAEERSNAFALVSAAKTRGITTSVVA